MKVFIVTESQIQSLRDRIELNNLRSNKCLTIEDQKLYENNELYQSLTFVVNGWLNEIRSDI